MIKKLFLYIFLIFFITNVLAKEIVIECKYKKYKYIFKNSGNVIMSTKKKVDPNSIMNPGVLIDPEDRVINHWMKGS